jgi:L-ascorbate metabolism protein UlaG (beta-lactamase superfamily)
MNGKKLTIRRLGMLILTFIVGGSLLLLLLFLRLYPVFGGKWSREKFFNEGDVTSTTTPGTNLSLLKDLAKGNPNGKPIMPISIETIAPELLKDRQTKVIWFGHSAFLVEIGSKTLLLDPMFGKAPTPFPWFGNKRYSKKLPLDIEQLPPIDAVLLSHDHYDHLDYDSIQKLKHKVGSFYVPSGVGRHLIRWGIHPSKIHEFNWWEEAEFEGLRFACTPAIHFSGRYILDNNSTLWCSWVIAHSEVKLFFSGDSGYGPHFKTIGEKYGPFNLTLMECGQYDYRWPTIHMLPEETVQAQLDVRGEMMIPIHWAAFKLAFHDWTDPIDRIMKAAKERGVAICSPRIGEVVSIQDALYPSSVWWK